LFSLSQRERKTQTDWGQEMSEELEKNIGRNEPCPCGSGKKYKRCCGVGAAPKLSAPAVAEGSTQEAQAAFDPASLGMDQQKMMEVAQAMQRLPRGQLQRIQALMQKAMSGKDVSREAAEFEKTLPVEFQQMLRALQPGAAGAAEPATGSVEESSAPGTPEMTEEQARELVAQAAAEGKIAAGEAEKLLGGVSSETGKSKFSKFLKPFSRK